MALILQEVEGQRLLLDELFRDGNSRRFSLMLTSGLDVSCSRTWPNIKVLLPFAKEALVEMHERSGRSALLSIFTSLLLAPMLLSTHRIWLHHPASQQMLANMKARMGRRPR